MKSIFFILTLIVSGPPYFSILMERQQQLMTHITQNLAWFALYIGNERREADSLSLSVIPPIPECVQMTEGLVFVSNRWEGFQCDIFFLK